MSRPRRVVARAGTLGGEVVRVVAGTSTLAPSRRDRRFTDVDLRKVTVDSYVVGGVADHICPWQPSRICIGSSREAVPMLTLTNRDREALPDFVRKRNQQTTQTRIDALLGKHCLSRTRSLQ